MGDYYHAIPWLEEAVSLFRGSYGEWNTEDEASLEDALDHLAFAYFQVGECFHHNKYNALYSLYNPISIFMSLNLFHLPNRTKCESSRAVILFPYSICE